MTRSGYRLWAFVWLVAACTFSALAVLMLAEGHTTWAFLFIAVAIWDAIWAYHDASRA